MVAFCWHELCFQALLRSPHTQPGSSRECLHAPLCLKPPHAAAAATCSTLRDDRAAAAYPGAPWNANLAAQLLDEKAKGSRSPLWPYIQTLPVSCSSTLQLQEQQLQEVQYRPAIEAITSYQAAVREAYDNCCKARAEAGQQQFGWQDWQWAVHMVQSRSIRLAITGCKVMIPGEVLGFACALLC